MNTISITLVAQTPLTRDPISTACGKYKDRLIADLSGHYLAWFAREGFPAGQLGRLLALMHEIAHNNLRELLTPLRDKRG
ncbi:MAG: Uncharacterized protein YpeB [Candidatus Burkholderia crenata]|nr:MAG: Uncharacterized protein YpeB [Candidatus Burkholderia crenata]